MSDELPEGYEPRDIGNMADIDWSYLDAQPTWNWILPPDYQIRPEDKLSEEQMRLVRSIVERRKPSLLPQLDKLGSVVQLPSERESLRVIIFMEYDEFGRVGDVLSESNEYGEQLQVIMARLEDL